jgi:colanic acid/amylovoran biosynthesis glycosyltransferase
VRIAVFTSEYPGRPATFFGRDIRAFVQSGMEVDVFPIRPPNVREWDHVPGWLREVLPAERVHHLSPFRNPVPSVLGTGGGKSDTVRILGSATRFGMRPLLKSAYAVLYGLAVARAFGRGFDHILAYWGNYPATSAYVYAQATCAQTPFSMFLHAGTDLYRDQVFLEQKLLAANNVIVVCDFNRRFIESKYPRTYARIAEKVFVYHLGLDLEEFAFHPGQREPGRLVCVGRLDALKGFDDTLRALALLESRNRKVRLGFVGDGPERVRLRNLAIDLKVAHLVDFMGWLTTEDTSAAIAKAAVLVHSPKGLGDAVPTVIKEAMALGTPVVATNVAGIPELLDQGRCGILVPPRDPRALADSIEGLLLDPDRWRATARAAREFAEERFDMRRNGIKLIRRLSGRHIDVLPASDSE